MVGNPHRHLAVAVLLAVCCLPLTAAGASSSAGNGQIAFVRDGAIYAVDPDGANEELLVSSEEENGGPAWSLDGRTLAFDRDARLYILQADGSETSIPTCDYDHDPSWSPDGQRLAFFNQWGKIGRLGHQTLDGETRTHIFSGVPAQEGPVWSPDGSSFAFANESYFDNGVYLGAIWLMGADGSDPHAITDKEDGDGAPAWSPDGTRLVFQSRRDGNLEIYVMNADGSDQQRLTEHPGLDEHPAWSPDGTKIAFVSDREGSKDIYTMNQDGSDVTKLTSSAADEHSPAWRPVPPIPPEGPTFDPPPSDCETTHDRDVTLHLKGSLVAWGRVKAEDYPTCEQGRIRIERRRDGEWRRIRGVEAGVFPPGDYRIELRERPGRYRTRVKELRVGAYYDRRVDVCPEVVSGVVVHRD